MHGRINLYHNESIVKTNLFNTEDHRLQIIETWRKLYGKGFDKTSVETIYEKGVKQLKKELAKEEENKLQDSPFKKGKMLKYGKLNTPRRIPGLKE